MIQPIIKYNGGIGAFICVNCGIIIKEHLSKKEVDGHIGYNNIDCIFCSKCKDEFDIKNNGLEKES